MIYSRVAEQAFYLPFVNMIDNLHTRGFNSSFNLLGNRLFCIQTKSLFDADEFDIVEVHSFANGGFPEEEAIVYVIECLKGNVKGILLYAQSGLAATKPDILFQKVRRFWK